MTRAPFDLPAAAQMHQAGARLVDIAEATGVAPSTASRHLREAGLGGSGLRRGRQPDLARYVEIIGLRDGRGLTFAAIGEELNITRQAAAAAYKNAIRAQETGELDAYMDEEEGEGT